MSSVSHICVFCVFLGNGADASTTQDIIGANGVQLCLSPSFACALICLSRFHYFFLTKPSLHHANSPYLCVLVWRYLSPSSSHVSSPQAVFCSHVTVFPSWVWVHCICPLLFLSSFGCLPPTWPLSVLQYCSIVLFIYRQDLLIQVLQYYKTSIHVLVALNISIPFHILTRFLLYLPRAQFIHIYIQHISDVIIDIKRQYRSL